MKLARMVLAVPSIALATVSFAQVEVLRLEGHSNGDLFGVALAFVGDVDGDGHDDFAVGAPMNDTAGTDAGQVELFSGRTVQVLRTWNGVAGQRYFGSAIAGVGDLDGDGIADVLVGAGGWAEATTLPTFQPVVGYARLFSGASGALLHAFDAPPGAARYGYSLAGGADLDGDGVGDLLIGAPGVHDSGYLYVYSGATRALLRRESQANVKSFGFAVSFLGDLNGDGVEDYVAGAPVDCSCSFGPSATRGWLFALDGTSGATIWAKPGFLESQHGWSLARAGDLDLDGVEDLVVGLRGRAGAWFACVTWSEIRVRSGATGAQIRSHADLHACSAYGSAVASVGDLDGDGQPEYVGGGPGWWPGFDPTERSRIFGGAQGTLVATVDSPNGSPLSYDAWGFAFAAGDANGDGLSELLVGAPWDDANGANAGMVSGWTIVRAVTTYCSAKVNSQGCTPRIDGVGTPSATLPQPFRIKAADVLNNKSGLLFYGFVPQAAPFQGGHLCVRPPTSRTPIQVSGGNPPPDDCSGAYSFDFNQHIRSGVDPALVAGREVFAQHWTRDPASPSTTGLTDALAFQIAP